MCGGGGDNGAEQLRKDEAERERKMSAAIAEINKMFGVAGEPPPEPMVPSAGYYGGNEVPVSQRRAELERLLTTATRPVDDGDYSGYRSRTRTETYYPYIRVDEDASMGSRYNASAESQAQRLRQELASLPATPNYDAWDSEVAANAEARKGLYDSSREDVLSYFRDALDQQHQRAGATVAVDMARKGMTYGSGAVDAGQRLQETYNTRLLDLTNRADASVTDMRSGDEQSRLDLIARIRAGMDQQSAVAGASASLRNNIDLAKSSAMAGSLEGLFADVEQLYGTQKAVDAYNKGYRDTVGVRTPGSYGASTGRVVNQ